MLDRGKRLRGKLLYIGIIAVLRVFFEKLHRILVRIDLLTGVCFVEILSGRTIEIIDKLLMLGIELCGNVYFDIFGFYDAQRRTLSASRFGPVRSVPGVASWPLFPHVRRTRSPCESSSGYCFRIAVRWAFGSHKLSPLAVSMFA